MSEAQEPSRSTTPMTTETVINRPATPQAPKKSRSKIFEYLKPSVYKPLAKEIPSAPKAILGALSRAGVRVSPPKTRGKDIKVKYPAPRKLTVHVVDGKTDAMIHKYVPTHLLMDISSKAAKVLEFKPWVGRYKIYGKYNPSAMSNVLDTIIRSQPIPVSTTNLAENLLAYEACLRLGISSTHHSLKALLTAIYTQMSATPIDNEVLAFVTCHLGSKDPVFNHMANVLCHQRFTKSVPDVQAFEKMVAKKPALQKGMVQIDQAHKARREAINATKGKWVKSESGETGSNKSDIEEQKAVSMQAVEEMLGEAALAVELKKDSVDEKHKERLIKLFKNEAEVNESDETID